jgi:hypothetical protein
MMNMFSHVRFHILTSLGLKENKTLEYNFNACTLIVNLHKLVPNDYDDEEQMSSILMHIYFRVVDHIIIHVYVESCI